jgi:hypothetical protein
VSGLVQITDFVDSGDMIPDLYPDIGFPIATVVVSYGKDDRHPIWLSVNPRKELA